MKKKLLSVLTSGFALAILVPATTFAAPASTDVSGVVTNNGHPVANAQVRVTCNSKTKKVATDSSGTYLARFKASVCPNGSTVTVNAKKHSQTGANSGTVSSLTEKLNVALVNVSLPEFGLLTGGAAILIGGAAFAVVRRRQLSGHQA
ncbi:MAG TPA: hypothetical protein VIJ68_00225 [Candidatus Saccharimonadales bacterium]